MERTEKVEHDKIKTNVQNNQIQTILTHIHYDFCFYDLVIFALFASGYPILFKKIFDVLIALC